MDWFGINTLNYPFAMFSMSHIIIIFVCLLGCIAIYLFRERIRNIRSVEIIVAWSLIVIELIFHLWQMHNSIWFAYQSLPLELCSIGLILCIVLLLTGRRLIYELLLFIALLGATQAILTPVLDLGFPHFRFLHFFYTHFAMIWTVLYFTWVKNYRPTLRSVGKIFIFLNLLLPVILLTNHFTGGNYMFLSRKPETASLLDFLGPHPYYIFSLEALLIGLSLIVWLIFREKSKEGSKTQTIKKRFL